MPDAPSAGAPPPVPPSLAATALSLALGPQPPQLAARLPQLPQPRPSPEYGNTPVDDLRDAAEAEESLTRRGLRAADAGSPPLPRGRFCLGTLLLVVGFASLVAGIVKGEPAIIAVGALAFLPGFYNTYLFFLIYCLRRRELFNELRDNDDTPTWT